MNPLGPEAIAALVSIPAALAVIVTVFLFLKHDAEQQKQNRDALATQRAEDRAVWSNHLSQSITVQADTARNLGEVAVGIALLKETATRDMEWAKDGMQALIREIGRTPAKD